MAGESIVLDNSINTRLLWPDTESPANNRYALKVIRQASGGSVFHVPTIWHYEAAQVASRLVQTNLVSQANVVKYLSQVALLPIVTDTPSHANAAGATFALSIQFGLSVYDAAYLELALRLGGVLATNDKQFQAAARRAGAPLFKRWDHTHERLADARDRPCRTGKYRRRCPAPVHREHIAPPALQPQFRALAARLASITWEQLVAETVLVGSPERIVDRVREMEAAGVGELRGSDGSRRPRWSWQVRSWRFCQMSPRDACAVLPKTTSERQSLQHSTASPR